MNETALSLSLERNHPNIAWEVIPLNERVTIVSYKKMGTYSRELIPSFLRDRLNGDVFIGVHCTMASGLKTMLWIPKEIFHELFE